jgi:hypothetical protein
MFMVCNYLLLFKLPSSLLKNIPWFRIAGQMSDFTKAKQEQHVLPQDAGQMYPENWKSKMNTIQSSKRMPGFEADL